MNVTVENLGPCKKLLRVEIEPELVESVFKETTGRFQHQARLPGFRPGKAPMEMVAKRFEKDIEEEAKHKLLQDGYRKAVDDNKFNVVGQPDVEEIQFTRGQPMQLAITVEISPPFELPEYKGLPAVRGNSQVTPEDIERALQALAAQKTEYPTVARELKTGDVGVINYTGTCDGKPITDLNPTARGLTSKQNFWVAVDATSFIPGFGTQLAGMKAGDKRTITVDFPPDFVVSELVGKKGVYEVELVEAKEKKEPAIDENFAKAYGAENLEKLRTGVRADLQNELNNKISRTIRSQVTQGLLDKIQIPLPESLVEHETRDIVYSIVHDNTKRGTPKEVIDSQTEQIYATARETAMHRVKAQLVFQAVAEKEGVRIEQSELLHRLEELAAQYKVPAEKFVKDMQKNGRIGDVASQLLAEKVINLLVQFARVDDVPAPAKA
ncbi:MAG TPA: trigger factor [Verrucomicrobiae bacterium]